MVSLSTNFAKSREMPYLFRRRVWLIPMEQTREAPSVSTRYQDTWRSLEGPDVEESVGGTVVDDGHGLEKV